MGMKVRFGIGLGLATPAGQLASIVDHLETSGVDSLWFSELVYSPAVDPVVGMAYALARTERLKVGTSVAVLPGRHPVLVAKQLASLAAVAPKRVLPVFGSDQPFPLSAKCSRFPTASARRCLRVTTNPAGSTGRRPCQLQRPVFHGDCGRRRAAAQSPAGHLAGRLGTRGVPRIGALADGWLGNFLTPDEARAGREAIERAAAEAGRQIEPDHFGISLAVADGELPTELAAAVRRRRPDVDPAELVAADWDQLHRQLDAYQEAGLTNSLSGRQVRDRPTPLSTGSLPNWPAGKTDQRPR